MITNQAVHLHLDTLTSSTGYNVCQTVVASFVSTILETVHRSVRTGEPITDEDELTINTLLEQVEGVVSALLNPKPEINQ